MHSKKIPNRKKNLMSLYLRSLKNCQTNKKEWSSSQKINITKRVKSQKNNLIQVQAQCVI